MVKIRDLSDKQLVTQLEKYEKIYLQLVGERDKRVNRGTQEDLLLTKREKDELGENREEKKVIERSPEMQHFEGHEGHEGHEGDDGREDKTQAFHLKFEDEEIVKMEKDKEEEEKANEPEDEDEVRVTQLLQLSKEQMDELKKPAVKKIVKKKKVRKKS